MTTVQVSNNSDVGTLWCTTENQRKLMKPWTEFWNAKGAKATCYKYVIQVPCEFHRDSYVFFISKDIWKSFLMMIEDEIMENHEISFRAQDDLINHIRKYRNHDTSKYNKYVLNYLNICHVSENQIFIFWRLSYFKKNVEFAVDKYLRYFKINYRKINLCCINKSYLSINMITKNLNSNFINIYWLPHRLK